MVFYLAIGLNDPMAFSLLYLYKNKHRKSTKIALSKIRILDTFKYLIFLRSYIKGLDSLLHLGDKTVIITKESWKDKRGSE